MYFFFSSMWDNGKQKVECHLSQTGFHSLILTEKKTLPNNEEAIGGKEERNS